MRLGLIPRIAIALAAVGLIPLVVAVFPLIGINQGALQDQVLQNHITAARAAASRLGTTLGSLATLADSLAENPLLADSPRSPAAQELLASVLQARPDLGALAVTDHAGKLVVRLQRRDRAEEMEQVLSQPLGEGLRRIAGAAGGWLLLDRPLLEGVGYLRLVADVAPLAEAVESIELGRGEADLVLADHAGEVLAGNVTSLADFPPALVEAGRSRQLSEARLYPEADGGGALGAVAPVPGSNWFVASRQPAEVAERVAGTMRRRSFIAIGVALLLVGGLSFAAQSSLVRPIRLLIAAQRRLAGLAPAPATGNEITQLRSSFAVLEEQIRTREEIDKVFLGRYQVVELLDEGAMGTIFKGWDPKLQRPLALKTVRLRDPMLDRSRHKLSTQLLREAVTAARLLHPNIVSVFDVEDTPEVAFIAMELVDGIGLDRLLTRQGPLLEEVILVLGTAIARALEHSHENGVVHRDIKPANILLGFDGSIKVADFGVAELISAMAEKEETVFGTPGYMPPETLMGEGFSEQGDLFALGVVLYECLTGEQPFARRSLKETALRTLNYYPEPPRHHRPEISAALEDLVLSLIAKKRRQRPRDAAEVLAALARIHGSAPLEWHPEQWFSRSDRTGPRTIVRSRLLTAVATRQISGGTDP